MNIQLWVTVQNVLIFYGILGGGGWGWVVPLED